MMKTIRKRAALFGSVAALSLALAACSSDADTADTEDDATEDAASEDMESALTLTPVGDACSAVPTDGEGSSEGMADDLVATAASNNPLLSTLVTAVGEAGLGDTLNGLEGATVFAPINDAFDAFTEDELNALLADTEQLTAVLTAHVVPENLTLEDLEAAGSVTTVQGTEISFDFSGGDLPVVSASNEAAVICGNVQTANATVHLIDTVLLPVAGDEMADGEMESALTLTPVGEACAAVPADGEGSSEGMADDPVATAASNNPLLSTLVTAVGEAGLVDTLNGLEGATVFAPINDAFGAFTEDELNALLADTDALTTVLTTHVIGENLTLDDLSDGDTLGTVAQNELTVSFADGSELPTITSPNGTEAAVICGNVQTANATVFLIDTVLLPSS